VKRGEKGRGEERRGEERRREDFVCTNNSKKMFIRI